MQRSLLLFLAIFAAAAAGVGLGILAGFGSPPPPVPSGNEALAKAVGDLSAAVEALREQLAAFPRPKPAAEPGSAREERGSPAPSGDLGKKLDALGAKIDLLRGSLEARPASADLPSLQTARLPDRSSIERVRATAAEERHRDHAMWTFRDVLDRYGRPDKVDLYFYSNEPTFRWSYELSEDRLVRFVFLQGFVAWVQDERVR